MLEQVHASVDLSARLERVIVIRQHTSCAKKGVNAILGSQVWEPSFIIEST